MDSMGKLDYFIEINTKAYLVDMPALSLKIFLWYGKVCPFLFLDGAVHTPDAMINWIC